MAKFVVGQRVAFYISTFGRRVGVISDVSSSGILTVQQDAYDMNLHLVHPKQCRLLKKKERRRVYISQYIFVNPDLKLEDGRGEPLLASDIISTKDTSWAEFIEVKK